MFNIFQDLAITLFLGYYYLLYKLIDPEDK